MGTIVAEISYNKKQKINFTNNFEKIVKLIVVL